VGKPSRMEAQRVVEEYLCDLREIIRKLRGGSTERAALDGRPATGV
jgi:hypothetical protein